MKNKKSRESLVLEYHPNAKVEKRPTGKEYYWIVDGNSILGQGKTPSEAWSAAYNNVYDH